MYIEEGCITCDACEEAAPEVFEVTDDTCFIKSDVRLDGGFDRNDSKSALKKEAIQTLSDDIFDAADGCPVDVIIVVEAQADKEEKEVEAPVIEVEAAVDVGIAEEPLVVEGLDAFLSTGDRTLNIFSGSQSGNSEELAAKLAKNAAQYGMEGVVHDMDGFDINSMASMKRVAIVCSTWGEGEMPDNAEALWQAAASESAPRMDGMSFTVLALGDTSYELFCQSGKDWDKRLEELGANRVVNRVDCDVDYEAPASLWAEEALTMLSATDDSGNLHEELIHAIRDLVSGGVSAVDGEDGFTLPDLSTEEVEVQLSVSGMIHMREQVELTRGFAL